MTALSATTASSYIAHTFAASNSSHTEWCQTQTEALPSTQSARHCTKTWRSVRAAMCCQRHGWNTVVHTRRTSENGAKLGRQLFKSVCKAGASARVNGTASATAIDVNEQFRSAAKAGDLRLCKELLALGEVDVNRPSSDKGGWTALQLSVFYQHPEVAEFLLDNGADIDGRNASGNTALQFACIKGDIRLASLLIDRGADVFAQSSDKGTAIDYAEEWGDEEIVNFMHLKATQQSRSEATS